MSFFSLINLILATHIITYPASLYAITTQTQHIVIDPGHGGIDRGATRDGVFESTITLAVAQRLADRLTQRGYRITMTRNRDEGVGLEKRALIANENKADLFLSIHLNSSKDPRAQGKEFYFQNQLPVDEEAQYLASRENAENAASAFNASTLNIRESNPGAAPDRIDRAGLPQAEAAALPALLINDPAVKSDVRRILADLNRNDRVRRSSELAKVLDIEWKRSAFAGQSSSRSIRQAPFFLVSNVAAPSVLVEVGFLSHKREGVRLQSADYQAALADSLADGVAMYFKQQAN